MSYQSDSIPARRWAVTDIAYVRENYSHQAVNRIAEELNEPVRRVRNLVTRLKKEMIQDSCRDQQTAHAVQIVHLGSTNAETAMGSTSASAGRKNAPAALQSAPADLLAFVQGQSNAEASRALGLARGTVHRLRHGYWPEDARYIEQAWSVYQARTGRIASNWFLRRVRGESVTHAGQKWSAPGLALRSGQLLAVARGADGSLLAQTLELPAERLHLAVHGDAS